MRRQSTAMSFSNVERTVVAPISLAQQMYGGGNSIHMLAIAGREDTPSKEVETACKSVIFAKHLISPDDEKAAWCMATAEMFDKVMSLFWGIGFLTWIVGLGTLLAGIVGVSNIMLITVRERTREFGIRKAIGATPFSILKLIIVESILITAVFGYLGMILGIGLTEGINSVMEMMNAGKNVSQDDMSIFLNPTVNLSVVLSATALIIGAGVLAGYFPARKAVKITAIEAMRNE